MYIFPRGVPHNGSFIRTINHSKTSGNLRKNIGKCLEKFKKISANFPETSDEISDNSQKNWKLVRKLWKNVF